MSLSDLFRWLAADWTHSVAAAGAVALAYAFAWAAIRASYERVTGHPMPRTRLVLALDIAADLAVNLPGGLNRWLRATGRGPLFLPAPPPRASAPAADDGQRGAVSAGALVMIALTALAVCLWGCPRLPPQSGCDLGAQRCASDHPEVCSASGRWHRVGDLSCAAVGGACLTSDGRAFCGTAEAAPGDVGLAHDGGAP